MYLEHTILRPKKKTQHNTIKRFPILGEGKDSRKGEDRGLERVRGDYQ